MPPPVLENGPKVELPPLAVAIASNRGHGVVEVNTVDLTFLGGVPLLEGSLPLLRRAVMEGKTGASLKRTIRGIRDFADYCRTYADINERCPARPQDVGVEFCQGFISWLALKDTSEPERSRRFRVFRSCMRAIGVDEDRLPSNPFLSNIEATPPDELSPEEARSLLKRAKLEARVVLSRREEVARLTAAGRDPRRGRGAGYGAWKIAANRVWIMLNVFKLRIRNFDEMRFQLGFNAEMQGLASQPGAEIVAKDGSIERQVGWKGHLRWFYPWSDDLAPFLTMFLLRTNANLAAAAALRSGQWDEPYPFAVGDASSESHSYIVTYKTRGRRHTTTESKPLRFVSSRRPWSHPYRVLLSVEDLTRELRAEIDRRTRELRAMPQLGKAELAELDRLVSIRDDLFVFKTEQGISSLAWELRKSGSTPRWLTSLFARAGVTGGTRRLRDAAILFTYEMSGQSLFLAQLTAAHSSKETTALYLRRQGTLNKIFDNAVRVFGLSLDLIGRDDFEIGQLRRLLADQGFDARQVANLEDPGNVSRWGNRCADPTNPPLGFSTGTGLGGICAGQDCIDGCPHARWFRESIDHVARNLVLAENTLETLGTESIEGSSLLSRIDRCRELLGRWPPQEATKALINAFAQLHGSSDQFLGPAL